MSDIIEENDKLLEAWNEWKIICSIHGCSEDNKKRLKALVDNAFMGKLRRVLGTNANSFKPDDCSFEFDKAIIERANFPGIDRRSGKEKTVKNYKDFVWNLIENSDDPPLKIIHGWLIGLKGIINDIVINYLNAQGFRSGHNTDGKLILVPPTSTDAPLEGKDGSQIDLEQLIPAEHTPGDLDEADVDAIRKFVSAKITPKMAALILAKAVKITFEERALLKFIGVEKSQAYEYFKEAQATLAKFLDDEFDQENWHSALHHLFSSLYSIIQSEKEAEEFLSLLKTKGIPC